MTKQFSISTSKRYELFDITNKVEEIVKDSGVKDGMALVFVPHSTAGVLLTENESGLKKDWVSFLKDKLSGYEFLHNRIDDNADSHILSGLIGQGKVLAIDKNLVRGTWQQIFLAEFDGPRTRKLIVKIIKSQ